MNWWYLVILFPIALGGLILWARSKNKHTKKSATVTTTKEEDKKKGHEEDHGGHHPLPGLSNETFKLLNIVTTIVIAIAVIVVIVMIRGMLNDHADNTIKKEAARQELKRNAPPAPPPLDYRAPCTGGWSHRNVEVPASGLAIPLCQGWETQPTTKITITNPMGKIIKDYPGNVSDVGYQPDGPYFFQSDPTGQAFTLRIYNAWE